MKLVSSNIGAKALEQMDHDLRCLVEPPEVGFQHISNLLSSSNASPDFVNTFLNKFRSMRQPLQAIQFLLSLLEQRNVPSAFLDAALDIIVDLSNASMYPKATEWCNGLWGSKLLELLLQTTCKQLVYVRFCVARDLLLMLLLLIRLRSQVHSLHL